MMRQIVTNKTRNQELADIFHQMAGCYRYLGPEQRFRSTAYENASGTIQSLKDDISIYAANVKSLNRLNNIGSSIAEKIIEYLETGKIAAFERLKREVPEGLLELMNISSFGPATVKLLHENFDISNKEDLILAIESGKLKGAKGLGEKKLENLMRGLKLYKTGQERVPLSTGLKAGTKLLETIQKINGIVKADLAGSLRRGKKTIGDIDMVICVQKQDWKRITNRIKEIEQIERILVSGDTKVSFLLKQNHIQVDIRLVQVDEYGAALLYFTGSKEHTLKLRLLAKEKGWKLNEYGLFDVKTGEKLAGKTEQGIYERFGMKYIPPELREGRDEIELANEHKLPDLVKSAL
ncbi:DNA polymerase/3'-5' exonuclease PolX [Sediminibacterium magnilacihabitans]|jgi:DNA polymerase (family 10)|nr:DNA polymerase/3'-5' exonuclease PolX [Sediminibacterium magnilacihabitans]